MTDYVLVATRFDRALTRDEKGFVLKTERLYAGAILSDLDEAEAQRLLSAGAITEVVVDTDADQVDPDPASDPPVDPPVDPVVPDEPVRPNKTAPVKAWEDYAAALFQQSNGERGLSRADAEAASKQDLLELFS